tara:strand:- start:22233 stop:23108 length:876 start_codon:yes stop_codon:yes gene_type:complete
MLVNDTELLELTTETRRLAILIKKRTPYQHKNVPFIVLWSQKAGCTSVLKWFLWHAELLEEANQYKTTERGLSIHLYENQVLKKLPNYRRDLVDRIAAGDPIICFLRCPYTRVFSSYMHLQNRLFIGLERKGGRTRGLDLRHTVLKSIYGSEVPVDYPISFPDYLNWLEVKGEKNADPHHSQQHTPLHELTNVMHYRLEDKEDVISRLEQDYGLNTSKPYRSQFSSPHHMKKSTMEPNAIITLLERGVPLNRLPKSTVPTVDRHLLVNSPFGDQIERIFRQDILLYDSIPS